jgi:hypothetical protein
MMRIIATLVLTLALASCSSLPGSQTLGLTEDPDRGKKALLVRMGLVVDALGIYGKLCAPVKTDACKSPQHYADAKLIAATIVDDAQLVVDGKLSPLAAGIIFGLTQAQLIKTLADEPAPTKPDAAPTQETIAYIDAIGAGLLLIQTADDRVAEGYGVNTTVAELMTDLQAKVAALP